MSERIDESRDEAPVIISRFGLSYTSDIAFDVLHLSIPQDIVKKVGGIRTIASQLYPNVFGATAPVAAETEFFYMIQFAKNTPVDKVQTLVDAIEGLIIQ